MGYEAGHAMLHHNSGDVTEAFTVAAGNKPGIQLETNISSDMSREPGIKLPGADA